MRNFLLPCLVSVTLAGVSTVSLASNTCNMSDVQSPTYLKVVANPAPTSSMIDISSTLSNAYKTLKKTTDCMAEQYSGSAMAAANKANAASGFFNQNLNLGKEVAAPGTPQTTSAPAPSSTTTDSSSTNNSNSSQSHGLFKWLKND